MDTKDRISWVFGAAPAMARRLFICDCLPGARLLPQVQVTLSAMPPART
jgi:hypothetical protein